MRKIGLKREGGKYHLVPALISYTRYHKVFLSLFSGACWFEAEKEKAEIFEQWNDIDKELINYIEVIAQYHIEFEKYKEGFFGLLYDKTLDRFRKILENDLSYEEIIQLPIEKRIERAYAYYYLQKLTINDSMSKIGLPRMNRPIKSEHCGLLTKLKDDIIKRLQNVHLTCIDFEDAYLKFKKHYDSNAYDVKPEEVLIFADKPYLKQNIYDFPIEKHRKLSEILDNTEFSFMLTCRDDPFNKESFNSKNIFFTPLKTRYSLNVHSNKNKSVDELLITNYDISQLGKSIPKMKKNTQQALDEFF